MKRFYNTLFTFALGAGILLLTSGIQKASITEADKMFCMKEYAAAGEVYKKVYSNTKSKEIKNRACFYTAECYRLSNDWAKAESWYLKTVKSDPKNLEAQYRYIQCLKYSEKYVEAITEFNNYKKMGGDDAHAEIENQGSINAQTWKNTKNRYRIENVKSINTKWNDYAPMWFKKDMLVYSSDRLESGVRGKDKYEWFNNGFSDIYQLTLKLNKKDKSIIEGYSSSSLIDKKIINGKWNDGVVCFDAKSTTMYFTKCNYGEKNDGKGSKCRIYVSKVSGTEWSVPEPLPFSTDTFNCGHPYLSKDGQTLYFSSDMPGSRAKASSSSDCPDVQAELSQDLWMVTYSKRGNKWGDPVNLGNVINSDGDEVFPFQHEDGTLYFASDGHVGMGGLDLFYAKGSGIDWSDPINMKSPLNSGGDDFSVIVAKDKESGYFSSNRLNGKGADDIYRFTMDPLRFTLSGVVRNCKTGETLTNALVTITNSSDTAKVILKTDAVGSYKLTIRANTDYELFATKDEDYFVPSKTMFQTTKVLTNSADLVQNFEICLLPIEEFIPVEGIYYGLDSADLRPISRDILDSLASTLKRFAKLRIELGSHTDCRADSIYNIQLSQRRADSAVARLIMNGIDSARIIAVGYGENALAVPKCKCELHDYDNKICSEAEHQLNRRTTVRILDFNYTPPKPKVAEPTRPGRRPGRPGSERPNQR